jgi:DNA recombination protein RmuC
MKCGGGGRGPARRKTGRSMSTAVNSYNALVGSLESRVLPQLRKLEELGILAHGTQLPQAQTVEAQVRPVPGGADPPEGPEP